MGNQNENEIENIYQKYRKSMIQIGKGRNSKIYKLEIKDKNAIYIIKEIDLRYLIYDQELIEVYQKLISITMKIKNENVIKYYSFFKENDSLIVIMEYGGETNLNQFIEKYRIKSELIGQERIKDIIIQICNGLKEFHNNSIILRCLNPYNIFIDNNHKIKISLPLSIYLYDKNIHYQVRLKDFYIAYEIIGGDKYTLKADIWSLGCIIYELFTLSNYCKDKVYYHEVKKIDTDIYNPKWQKLIDLLLKLDYRKRPNIDEALNFVQSI